MRIVTLARKPFTGSVAQTVVEHGTGVLNLDDTRISTSERMSFSRAAPYTDAEGVQGRTWNPTSTRGIEREQHEKGRWPANVVFQHQPECRCVGTKQVKPWNGSGVTGFGAGGFQTQYVGGTKKGIGFTGSYLEDDGTETVAKWECDPACPVLDLEAQSGISRSTGGKGAASGLIDNPSIYGKFSGENKGTSAGGFGDTGTAARFFKQVQS